MKSILITGGAGFIGSNFTHYWAKTYPGDTITVLDKLTYAGNLANLQGLIDSARIDFKQGDICDRQLLNTLFSGNSFDIVVHFAAESHVDRSITGPKDFIDTNITGTFNLLEVARNDWAGQSEKRFIHVSTDEVYGSLTNTDSPFTETNPYRPNSPYSASKASADMLARAYFHTYGLPVIITNCSNNYGPYQYPEKLIPLMIINCLRGLPLPIYGDGLNVRDWLYVEDHCRGIDAVIQKGVFGEQYNIGGCNEWANIDIVDHICGALAEELGKAPDHYTKLKTYVTDRPGHDRRYAIDNSKISTQLGWQPEIDFITGISSTIRWYVNNEQWWQALLKG